MLPLFRKIPTDNNAFIYRQYAVLKLNVLNHEQIFFLEKRRGPTVYNVDGRKYSNKCVDLSRKWRPSVPKW